MYAHSRTGAVILSPLRCVYYLQAGAVLAQSTRHVSLHEHHSMELMGSFGISVPYGEVAVTADQAKDITHRLGRHSLTHTVLLLHLLPS